MGRKKFSKDRYILSDNMKKALTIICIGMVYSMTAQDFHFTQSLQNTFLVNPASAGEQSETASRLTVLSRSQWDNPGTVKGYQGVAATYEWRHCLSNDRHFFALGIVVQHDWSVLGGLSNSMALPGAAYHIHLNDDWFMSAGAAVGLLSYTIREDNLKFDAQYINGNFVSTSDNKEQLSGAGNMVADMSSGFEIYNNLKGISVGVSWLHLNKPKYTFLDEENRLGISFIGHGSYTLKFNHKGTQAIAIKGLLRRQSMSGNNSRQWLFQTGLFGRVPAFGHVVQGGIYARWGGVSGAVTGVNAVIPTLLFHQGSWDFAWSYDINTSGIRTRFAGGMEFTAGWNFGQYDKCVNCPKF
jgi:type IX secretion system PorP/SprF family membrane protein